MERKRSQVVLLFLVIFLLTPIPNLCSCNTVIESFPDEKDSSYICENQNTYLNCSKLNQLDFFQGLPNDVYVENSSRGNIIYIAINNGDFLILNLSQFSITPPSIYHPILCERNNCSRSTTKILCTEEYIITYESNSLKGLYFFNASDLTNPEEVSSFSKVIGSGDNTSTLEIEEMYLENDLLTLLYTNHSFEILNIANITNAHSLGYYSSSNLTVGLPYSCFINNSIIYLGTSYGLEIYDFSIPQTPIKLGSYNFTLTGFNPEQITIENDRVFLVDNENQIAIFNCSDFSNITLLGYHDFSDYRSYTSEPIVRDSLLFITYPYSYLIINCSDPTNMQVVLDYSVTSSYNLVFKNTFWIKNRIYSVRTNCIEIVDVTNPLFIVLNENINLGDTCFDFAFYNDYLLITDAMSKVYLYNCKDIENAKIIDNLFISAPIYDIAVKDQYLFIATGSYEGYVFSSMKGLKIFDLSNINNPILLKSKDLGVYRYFPEITILGKYLFLNSIIPQYSGANYYYSLFEVFDISDLNNPVMLDDWLLFYNDSYPFQKHGTFFDDRYYYFMSSNSILGKEISGETIVLPHESAYVFYEGEPTDVFIKNGYIFVADRQRGLVVFNTSTERNWHFVAEYQIDEQKMNKELTTGKIFVDDEYAYLSILGKGIIQLDITDPTHINEVGRFNEGMECFSLTRYENSLVSAEGQDGVKFILFDRQPRKYYGNNPPRTLLIGNQKLFLYFTITVSIIVLMKKRLKFASKK